MKYLYENMISFINLSKFPVVGVAMRGKDSLFWVPLVLTHISFMTSIIFLSHYLDIFIPY